jgi:hypothetical protein
MELSPMNNKEALLIEEIVVFLKEKHPRIPDHMD